MDLEYDDKLAKDNNGINYLLFRQTCLIEPYMQKGWKQKVPKKLFCAFLTLITKSGPEKKGSIRE